jgi:hypothetical protein
VRPDGDGFEAVSNVKVPENPVYDLANSDLVGVHFWENWNNNCVFAGPKNSAPQMLVVKDF